jgi:hypothetical protein
MPPHVVAAIEEAFSLRIKKSNQASCGIMYLGFCKLLCSHIFEQPTEFIHI